MKKGIFITIEGGEACGKTTQINKLKEYFTQNNLDYVLTKEPGGMPLTDEIRRLILHYEIDKPLPMTELLLYLSARIEDIEKVIKPALEQGKIVIADRFNDSTLAYQAGARNIMSIDDMQNFTKQIIGDISPDLTIYLKIDPEVAFKRKNNMNEELDRIEKEGLIFHKKVSESFDYIASKEPSRFFVVDATLSPDEVFNIIINKINNILNENK